MPLIILLRHGQARNNVERVLAGRTFGYSLTREGQAQARAAARMLRLLEISRVYSSPVSRALQTAKIVAARTHSEVVPDERLVELDMGRLTGMPYADVESEYGDIFSGFYSEHPAVVENGVEPFPAVKRRMEEMTGEIVRKHPDGNVVLVTHMDPIKAMLSNIAAVPPATLAKLLIANAAMTVFGHHGGDVHLMGVNVMGLDRYGQTW